MVKNVKTLWHWAGRPVGHAGSERVKTNVTEDNRVEVGKLNVCADYDKLAAKSF